MSSSTSSSIPKISVIMPVYNGERYLADAIRSILAQTFGDFEFLIINDCSTDRSLEMIKSFNDPRILLIQNDRQSGVAQSLNKGISQAKGEYIARMDADDISLPCRLERQLAFMEKNLGIGISGTWVRTIDAYEKEKSRRWKKPTADGEIKILMFFSCPLIHPTVMFRRELFNQNNLRYNEAFKSAQDYELWSRAMDIIKFANIPEVLFSYRLHDKSITGTASSAQNENAEKIRAYLSKKIGMSALPSDAPLTAREQWLLAFRNNANLKKYSDDRTIRTVVDKIWFSACTENMSLGRSAFITYWKSLLRQNNLKSLIKCCILLFRTPRLQ